MRKKPVHPFGTNYFKALVVCMILVVVPQVVLGHDEVVHQAMTKSAFRSSSALMSFLSDTLGSSYAPFEISPDLSASPVPFPNGAVHRPLAWLALGSYYEDDEDPTFFDHHFIRSCNHFYTLSPSREPGQVLGLTDGTESHYFGADRLPSPIVNSFVWGTFPGLAGPTLLSTYAGPNLETWQDARTYELAALTSSGKATRDTKLALMLFALGHVLHLNQDLSQPEHTRNDEHKDHRAIENYGSGTYLYKPQAFPLQPHGWLYWQGKGFTKLLDFWDTGQYKNNSAKALNDEAAGTIKLGLAEFSNGNFLGQDALYAEYFKPGDSHYFPFPSLLSGTTFPLVRRNLGTGTRTSFLKSGKAVKRMYISKTADGIGVVNHSVLNYLGTKFFSPSVAKVSSTIDDANVLQEYHSLLIPKAIEYSAGILDYFLRGQLGVTVTRGSSQIQLHIVNHSGQKLSGGTFTLYQDDTSGNRTAVTLNLVWTGSSTLEDGGALDATFTGTFASNTKMILAYKGTIGATITAGGASPLDTVDAGIAIAAQSFTIPSVCVDFPHITWGVAYTYGSPYPPAYSLSGASISFDCESAAYAGSFVGDGAGSIRYTGPGCSCRATIHVTQRTDPPFGAGSNEGGFQVIQDGVTAATFDLSPRSKGIGTYTVDFPISAGTDSLIEIFGIYSDWIFNPFTGQPELMWFYDIADAPSSNSSPHGRLAWDATFTCLDAP